MPLVGLGVRIGEAVDVLERGKRKCTESKESRERKDGLCPLTLIIIKGLITNARNTAL